MEEGDIELLARNFDRVITICRYAERNSIYDKSSLEEKALQLFFVTPRQAEDLVKMALSRVQRALSRGLIS